MNDKKNIVANGLNNEKTNKPMKEKLNVFDEVVYLIQNSHNEVYRYANEKIIQTYWFIGKIIEERAIEKKWGKAVVRELSQHIISRQRKTKGFSERNIRRMKQFYNTYKDVDKKRSALLTKITWSNHLHIMAKTKTIKEREFYLKLAAKNHYPERAFARIIDTGTFERTKIAQEKLPTPLTEIHVDAKNMFKDTYVFEFLGIPEQHSEHDLKRALISHMKNFMLEMGPDFSLIGEEYIVQVGDKDFRIDLLLHHRGLNCLTAIEIKIGEFMPEHLGKLQFYLEALDRDVKKPHENPSVGILICSSKNDDVVEYALSRNVSPAMIAEYKTQLIDKKTLQDKLHELIPMLESKESSE